MTAPCATIVIETTSIRIFRGANGQVCGAVNRPGKIDAASALNPAEVARFITELKEVLKDGRT